jgi:hypothetical protein
MIPLHVFAIQDMEEVLLRITVHPMNIQTLFVAGLMLLYAHTTQLFERTCSSAPSWNARASMLKDKTDCVPASSVLLCTSHADPDCRLRGEHCQYSEGP